MTTQELNSFINKLNNKKTKQSIYISQLGPNVDFGKVWPKPVNTTISELDVPYNVYFIKNEEGFYVGCVLDMVNDLHWYIKLKYRKKGYLTKSMKDFILPHLANERNIQAISIDKEIGNKNFEDSKSVACNLGFKETKNGKYVLDLVEFSREGIVFATPSGVLKDRKDEIIHHINFLGLSLKMIQSEIEMGLGYSCLTEDMQKSACDIFSLARSLEEEWSSLDGIAIN